MTVLAGGLVGDGTETEIRYSYAIGVNISVSDDSNNIGGLIGEGANAVIHASYASGVIFPNGATGGLIGTRFGDDPNINYSYAAVEIPDAPVGSFFTVRSLLGLGTVLITASYWNTDIQMLSTGGGGGVGRTTVQLQSPTDFTGDYALWGNLWCDPNTGDEMESETEPDDDRFIRAWDLGTAEQYPALTCTPGGAERQRQR